MGARREQAVFWSAAALLVAGAALAYRLLLGPAPGAQGAAGEDPQAALRLQVARVTGEVTVVRGGARTRASVGDALRPDDAIETAPGARVTLSGASYDVELEEAATFDVREITAELSRFHLGQGFVSARVREEGRSVEIEGAAGTRVRTRGGDVAVARTGETVAVGVERGAAEFAAGGGLTLV